MKNRSVSKPYLFFCVSPEMAVVMSTTLGHCCQMYARACVHFHYMGSSAFPHLLQVFLPRGCTLFTLHLQSSEKVQADSTATVSSSARRDLF